MFPISFTLEWKYGEPSFVLSYAINVLRGYLLVSLLSQHL